MVGLRLCGRRQVFQQLEGLGGIVERLIGDVLKLAAAATREALDTSTLPADDEPGAKGRSAAAAAAMQQQRGPSKAHAAAWKTTLWSRMETLTEALLSRAGQVPACRFTNGRINQAKFTQGRGGSYSKETLGQVSHDERSTETLHGRGGQRGTLRQPGRLTSTQRATDSRCCALPLTAQRVTCTGQVWTLRRVLVAKRDPVTQQTFLELVSANYAGDGGDGKFFRSFWVRLFAAVGKALQAAADQNQFVRGMLTQDVARLRGCFIELYDTWVREAEPAAAGQARVVGEGERSAMLQVSVV